MKRLKLGQIAHIEWDDAHGGDDGWGPSSTLPHKPRRVVSIGQVARRSKTGYTLVLSTDATSKTNAAYIFIPLTCISKIKVLH